MQLHYIQNQQLDNSSNKSKIINSIRIIVQWIFKVPKYILTLLIPTYGNFSNESSCSSPPIYIRAAICVAMDIPSPTNMIKFFATFLFKVFAICSFKIFWPDSNQNSLFFSSFGAGGCVQLGLSLGWVGCGGVVVDG